MRLFKYCFAKPTQMDSTDASRWQNAYCAGKKLLEKVPILTNRVKMAKRDIQWLSTYSFHQYCKHLAFFLNFMSYYDEMFIVNADACKPSTKVNVANRSIKN